MVYFIVDTHPEQFLEKCYIKRDAFVWPPSKQNKDGYTVTLLEKVLLFPILLPLSLPIILLF